MYDFGYNEAAKKIPNFTLEPDSLSQHGKLKTSQNAELTEEWQQLIGDTSKTPLINDGQFAQRSDKNVITDCSDRSWKSGSK